VNFLALLGWSPGDDREVMTRAELRESFTLERVLKKSAVFDVKKLEWLNGQHLSRTPAAELEPGITKRLVEGGKARAEELAARGARYLGLIDLLKVRARTLDELAGQVASYLPEEVELDPRAVAKHWEKNPEATLEYLARLRGTFEACAWEEEPLEEALRDGREADPPPASRVDGAGRQPGNLRGARGDRARAFARPDRRSNSSPRRALAGAGHVMVS
jgi:glutamyl-tRNA synthetase